MRSAMSSPKLSWLLTAGELFIDLKEEKRKNIATVTHIKIFLNTFHTVERGPHSLQLCSRRQGPHSANSTFVVLENTAKLKLVSKGTSF